MRVSCLSSYHSTSNYSIPFLIRLLDVFNALLSREENIMPCKNKTYCHDCPYNFDCKNLVDKEQDHVNDGCCNEWEGYPDSAGYCPAENEKDCEHCVLQK